MLKETELQDNWQYYKREVLARWKRLTEEEVENAQGNLQALRKLVQDKYGEYNHFDEQIEEIYRQHHSHRDGHYEKNTMPTFAGARDNSAERKLNENFSRTISPDEESHGISNTPTIHETPNEH